MTFEDVKRVRENPTIDDVDNTELSKMIDIAIQKQIPQRVYRAFKGICECGKAIYPHMNYCNNCGQKLEWSVANK